MNDKEYGNTDADGGADEVGTILYLPLHALKLSVSWSIPRMMKYGRMPRTNNDFHDPFRIHYNYNEYGVTSSCQEEYEVVTSRV